MFADLERQEVMAEWEVVMARSPKARMFNLYKVLTLVHA